MYYFDVYETSYNRQDPRGLECYRRALDIVRQNNGKGKVYWVESEQHCYVVLPGEKFALNAYYPYPRLNAAEVEMYGYLMENNFSLLPQKEA